MSIPFVSPVKPRTYKLLHRNQEGIGCIFATLFTPRDELVMKLLDM
jgi:hypothetical protein